jgi:hypothetical protein
MSDGATRDVTNETTWHSSTPSVLSIDATGLAAGHERGETHLAASFSTRQSTRDVIVVPAGTYRLAGMVTESGASDAVLADALVEVTAQGPALALPRGQGRMAATGCMAWPAIHRSA